MVKLAKENDEPHDICQLSEKLVIWSIRRPSSVS